MSNKVELYINLTSKRNDLCFFFNRTKTLWTVQVLSPDDPGLVVETFHANSLEVLQPSYTMIESTQGKMRAFGVLRKRKDKDEIQITNI